MSALRARPASSEVTISHMGSHTGSNIATAAQPGRSPRSYIALSIVAAVLTIGLKFWAFFVTGSIGLFSDAAESIINLVAALVAFWMLTVAARPPDEEHAYGHTKAEYFSSGLESALILIAAAGIAWASIDRLLHLAPLENLGIGLAVSVVSTAINGGVAFVLLRAGKRLRSITLTADARHLLTDVMTSVGIVLGIILVSITGWLVLDPLIALLVAVNITWTGFRLLDDSAHGLLDTALPRADLEIVDEALKTYREQEIDFHALRTRISGRRRFISMHVLVPGDWSVQRGHTLCEEIEHDIITRLPGSTVFTHLEPVEDPVSMEDQELDRKLKAERDRTRVALDDSMNRQGAKGY